MMWTLSVSIVWYQIDCILASWLHLEQPTGAFDITNIAGYLKSSTDVPHFQFELVQCSPTYFILFLDLIPRKDIVLHPDYLKTYYEDTKIEALRQRLDQLSEVKPYFSSSLYFRCVVSPTGILVSIKCEDGGTERVEEIIREHVGPISNEIMGIWMDMCIGKGVEVGETERAVLEKRDTLIKSKAIEMDLSSSMPKQFGQEVADRVLRVIKSAFKTWDMMNLMLILIFFFSSYLSLILLIFRFNIILVFKNTYKNIIG